MRLSAASIFVTREKRVASPSRPQFLSTYSQYLCLGAISPHPPSLDAYLVLSVRTMPMVPDTETPGTTEGGFRSSRDGHDMRVEHACFGVGFEGAGRASRSGPVVPVELCSVTNK